jgi:predicted protein tyrosine phosphatase
MITLSSVGWASYAVDFTGAGYLVSLLSQETMIETPDSIEPENHVKLEVDDIVFDVRGRSCPNKGHIRRLFAFGRELEENPIVVVHCAMGRSRSAAAVIALLAQKNPNMENDIVNLVYDAAPHIQPNQLIIRLADEELGCEGSLIEAVEKLPVHWNEDFDDFVSLPFDLGE